MTVAATSNGSRNGKPFDLDALAAESVGEPFRFIYGGRQWSIPRVDDVDKRLLDRMAEAPDAVAREAFQLAFGEEWAEFDGLPMSLRTFNALLEEWSRYSGLELGEGLASPRS